MNKFRQFWNDLRASLWFVPGLMVFAAITLAVGLVEVDTYINHEQWVNWPRLFGAGASGSRDMLSAIASSMITVAGVTFSITIVVLSLASSQYTPRILRNFMSDRTNQIVLGFFVGIFTYCLIVLRTIRGGDEGEFIPSLAVAFGFVLALTGVGVLILFIHHIASSIQASHVISSAASETISAVKHLFPTEMGEGIDDIEEESTRALPDDDNWITISALKAGYIQDIDEEGMMNYAREREVILRMERGIGDFVVEGSPLASISGGVSQREGLSEKEIKAVNKLYSINRNRTVEQDAAFGIRQIVDIALKALSPSINDTTTALICVDYLGAVLSELANRRIETAYRSDGDELRVVAMGPTFAQLCSDSFDDIRLSAAGNPAVIIRMLRAVEVIAERTRSARRQRILSKHVHLLAEMAARSVEISYDRARIRGAVERALKMLNEDPKNHMLGLEYKEFAQ